jgi:serine/threonine-protein kinase
LIGFQRVSEEIDEATSSAPVDWEPLLSLAALKTNDLKEASPRRLPSVFAEVRAARTGAYPERPEIPLRVEAAAHNGRPVYFRVEPEDSIPFQTKNSDPPKLWIASVGPFLILIAVSAGAWLAWQNWRLGRANQSGALRLAIAVVGSELMSWLFLAHHSPSFGEEFYGLFVPMLGHALQIAGVIWLMFVAFEPYVRRRWPWRIVAWNRLLEGRWRDPLIGRDILIGGIGGLAVEVVQQIALISSHWLPLPPPEPIYFLGGVFLIKPLAVAAVMPSYVMQSAVVFLFLLLVLLAVARRESIAVLAYFFLFMWLSTTGSFMEFDAGNHLGWTIKSLADVFMIGTNLVILLRYGLVAFASWLLYGAALALPLTLDTSAWYFGATLIYAGMFAGLALYAFFISLGNRPLLNPAWVDDS